jgi:protocatechuate 3,4-dioxygenase beta subunit
MDIFEFGFKRDLAHLDTTFLRRRRLITGLGAATLGATACGGGSDNTGAANQSAGAMVPNPSAANQPSTSGTCTVVPSETAGPFPGDGTNSVGGSIVNALAQTGIVRGDITKSFAGASGIAAGVPLAIKIKIKLAGNSCAAASNRAVYLWHCDALGRYSMYSNGVIAENYLRGLQVAGANGEVNFTTIYPGCYAGRWPHIHFEVFNDLASATSGNTDLKTSQLALPRDTSVEIYSTNGYAGSLANLGNSSLANDGVFSDGSSLQMATITGSVATGLTATLEIAI